MFLKPDYATFAESFRRRPAEPMHCWILSVSEQRGMLKRLEPAAQPSGYTVIIPLPAPYARIRAGETPPCRAQKLRAAGENAAVFSRFRVIASPWGPHMAGWRHSLTALAVDGASQHGSSSQ